MNFPLHYIDKVKFEVLVMWLITLVILIIGFRFFKDAIVFIMTKLYEFFIQNHPSHL